MVVLETSAIVCKTFILSQLFSHSFLFHSLAVSIYIFARSFATFAPPMNLPHKNILYYCNVGRSEISDFTARVTDSERQKIESLINGFFRNIKYK